MMKYPARRHSDAQDERLQSLPPTDPKREDIELDFPVKVPGEMAQRMLQEDRDVTSFCTVITGTIKE